MVTFQVTKKMDLEEWKDHCWGSGWTTYPWWKDVTPDSKGLWVNWYEDCDEPDSVVRTGFASWQEIADKCSKLAETNSFVASQLSADDFDADGMDQVMQYVFMGEIIYG